MDPSIIDSFQELTGLRRQTCISIFAQHFPNLQLRDVDFHVVVSKALSLKVISPRNACVASMIHLTGLKLERVTTLIDLGDPEAPYDLNQAIIQASLQSDIDRNHAVTARMRALTMLSQSRAQFFLGQTSPQGYLESAISKARVANEISPNAAAMAQLKILTGFGDDLANRLLTGHNNIERAVVQGENAFKTPVQYALARIRARFSLMEQDARHVLLKQSVNGNFEEACRHIRADQVMAKMIVDRQDALEYLQKANDNVDNAIKLAQQNQLAQPFYGGQNADTRNPPNVHHNTHIVGVLGVSDIGHQRRASPRMDGWMVSDFYLWIHVLRRMGRSQTWLTSENPFSLVSEYGSEDKSRDYTDDDGNMQSAQVSWKEGYLHGDPFEDRVVVLDKKNVNALAQRVTLPSPGTKLRDEFLSCIEKTCKTAEAADEPVLLMAFCHGDDADEEMGGLCIGIDPGSQNPDDFLSPQLLAKTLNKTPNVRVSLFLTSCFSGNWVITPKFRLVRPTVMAAARQHEESYAWEISCSQRHAGGVYSSAFLKELQKEPAELPEDAEADEARTYAQLCRDIVSEANRLCLRLTGSTPMFTPEGGHDKFWERTGFSLADYKRNYDRLEKVPASDPSPYKDKKRPLDDISDAEFAAWQARHPEAADQEFGDRTGGYGSTRRGIKSSLTYLAKGYMKSFPGPRSLPSNMALQNDIELFFAGCYTDDDYEAIEKIRSQLLYRTWMMRSANSYRQRMNLNKVTTIQAWDQESPGNEKIMSLAKANLPMVRGSGLFNRPDAGQGYWGQVWDKPFKYLAWAFAASGYGPDDIPKYLQMLKQTQRENNLRKTRSYLLLPNAQKSIRDMSDILKRTWGRSATKRKRRSLEEAGFMPSSSITTASGPPSGL